MIEALVDTVKKEECNLLRLIEVLKELNRMTLLRKIWVCSRALFLVEYL